MPPEIHLAAANDNPRPAFHGRPVVSVITPTFRRTERALAAARSILAQTTDANFELILVDNDPAGGAMAELRRLAAETSIPVLVLHEPNPGVANARNAGLRAARGRFIAFLDDDEIAPLDWLTEMLRAQRELGADVVFGPVFTRLETVPGQHRDYFEAFFARDPGHGQRLIDEAYGCGCSLIRRAVLPSHAPFAARCNETGGEDDVLFEALRARGCRFGWAPDGYVFETPEPSRVTLDYTLRRAFAFGQGPATAALRRDPKNVAGAAFWMGVGLAQFAVFGPLALGAFALRANRRAFLYRRASEALGKLFWMPAFKPHFYGAARLPDRRVDSTRLVPAP